METWKTSVEICVRSAIALNSDSFAPKVPYARPVVFEVCVAFPDPHPQACAFGIGGDTGVTSPTLVCLMLYPFSMHARMQANLVSPVHPPRLMALIEAVPMAAKNTSDEEEEDEEDEEEEWEELEEEDGLNADDEDDELLLLEDECDDEDEEEEEDDDEEEDEEDEDELEKEEDDEEEEEEELDDDEEELLDEELLDELLE